MRSEDDLFVINRRQLGEAEDLKPAAVGQNRAVPIHQPVQAAQLFDDVGPRPQGQMIGVGQHHLHAGCRSCSGVSPLTVAAVPTGMKAGVWTTPCGVSRGLRDRVTWHRRARLQIGKHARVIVRQRAARMPAPDTNPADRPRAATGSRNASRPAACKSARTGRLQHAGTRSGSAILNSSDFPGLSRYGSLHRL